MSDRKLECVNIARCIGSDLSGNNFYEVVKNMEIYNVKNREIYNVKNIEIYNVKNIEIYNVKNIEIYNVKNMEIYNVKILNRKSTILPENLFLHKFHFKNFTLFNAIMKNKLTI